VKEFKRKLEFKNAKRYSLYVFGGGVNLKKNIMIVVISFVLLLSGCSFGTSVEKIVSDALAGMNSAEKEYRDGQVELTELEKSEQKLFNETMKLTQEQKEELKKNVTELESSLELRMGHIEKEEKSIKKAEDSIGSLDAAVKEADETTKKSIEQLKLAISKRYELHSVFISQYKELTTLQRELYEMLISEEIEMTVLRDKVGEVNSQNDLVKSAVTSFNDATGKMNLLKDKVFANFDKEK